MAGNRIDMIERAAARLRKDPPSPQQKPVPLAPNLPEKSTIVTAAARAQAGVNPISSRFMPAPKPIPAVEPQTKAPLSPPLIAPVDRPAAIAETSDRHPAHIDAAIPYSPSPPAGPQAQEPASPPATAPPDHAAAIAQTDARRSVDVHDAGPSAAPIAPAVPAPVDQPSPTGETGIRPAADVSAAIRSLAPAELPVPANESIGETPLSPAALPPVGKAQPEPPISVNAPAADSITAATELAAFEEKPADAPTAKHSRTVVLDTARLALAGTIDWSSDRTPVMEELRLIKRRLLRRAFNSANGPDSISHLVMITSAKPREGKTFTSTNIAISISLEEDYNVLLVDADIRRQALRQNLGLEANQGFVDLLLNPSLDMADVLLRTNIPRLSVLPAGTMSDRAPELLASSRMRDLIDDMAQRYRDRIIIFDTAPCLVSSDAATLAAHVGQVVFVIEAEQTQQHEIVAALNLISACPDISLVLNKAQPLATTSYGGYGAY